ncbi:Fatty acyl-CoA synthetase and RNA processing-associated kinase 1 [Colletotrichum tanaceti]|uniref:non-specific serine/threonine protein kinase n=1 Tax=Colletotrichum tanaceti TaxID=1306861 RepID=A0A4U6X9G2_9PEZI|nr:Fatty acyl-CoA synthetase and RNA processing-associated kinase 1 [Colletotrichum tanaceti]TKW51793.1 Fatty acyl-CoA synthetase and RNA processing-associated kinase 1 [Colletotrichum tanaceti]
MSSATLQPARQTPALASPPLLAASPSSRQYTSTHSSPTREAYDAISQNDITSPAPLQYPTSRPSGAGASVKSPDIDSSMTSRAAPANPVAIAPSSPDYQSSSSEQRKNMPPIAPPRTSSTNYSGGTTTTATTKRRDHAAEKAASSPRRGQADGTNGNAEYTYSDDGSASRSRRSHQQMAPDSPRRSTGNRPGSQPTVIPVRSYAPPQTSVSPKQPSREASEVLNRMVVSQPEVDVAREKERLAEAQPTRVGSSHDDAAPPPVVGMSEHDDGRRGGRSRHDHSGKREKVVRFGDYILGNTIGEGEFGKVKLGWKNDGGVQVAIKLIKRDSVGNNPSRLAKIYREIAILRGISHPNIVRLHEMVETERHIGIILEYASGGELFDYILNHRYLKDNAARRLFAQLVSGVGYLHKKGIVHRDLKLENLLLDRNRNIIITDFGFANTFDAEEDLSEEEELNLGDREFVKKLGLDRVKTNGTRKGDLMQTSCGSPCYAAPELVVSDSLYTGRKVDVWSCGVILYAMLAGYLPFDDDPANPEGDNINLLYKYIVNTPLTFPEYVTPHARDLLRRILVPNPRKRADLFEVARHSWLSEYAHVVEFITSSTTTPNEIQNTTVPSEDDFAEASGIGRSASVREASKTKANTPTSVGGLASKHAKIDADAEAAAIAKQHKDNKRRTVQVEYVAPTTQTQRGEPASTGGKSRARSNSQGPVEVAEGKPFQEKPLPRDPPVSRDSYRASRQGGPPPSAHRSTAAAPSRPTRDTRATSDNAFVSSTSSAPATGRPQTGGSMASGSMGLGAGSRASYSQPIPPAVAGTNAHGRIQQPSSQEPQAMGRPSVSVPAKFAKVAGFPPEQELAQAQSQSQTPPQSSDGRGYGHKRSSTISSLLGRNGSIFGGKNRNKRPESQIVDKSRKYPPVSMPNNMPAEGQSRPSIDSRASRQSFSRAFGKKRSGSIAGSQTSHEKQNRRFSLIPQSFSLKAIGIGRDYDRPPSEPQSQPDLPIQEPPEVDEHGRYMDQRGQSRDYDGGYDQGYRQPPGSNSTPQLQGQDWQNQQQGYQQQQQQQQQHIGPIGQPSAVPGYMQEGAVLNTGSEESFENAQPQQHHHKQQRRQSSAPYQGGGFSEPGGYDGQQQFNSPRANGRSGLLQKNTKKFTDAEYTGHQGSSGAAKRVMDFFRRRGKARGGDER